MLGGEREELGRVRGSGPRKRGERAALANWAAGKGRRRWAALVGKENGPWEGEAGLRKGGSGSGRFLGLGWFGCWVSFHTSSILFLTKLKPKEFK